MTPFVRRLTNVLSGALALALVAGTSALLYFAIPGSSGGAESGAPATPTPSASAPAALPCERQTLIGTVVAPRVAARAQPSSSAPVITTLSKINPQGAPQVLDLGVAVTDSTGGLWYRAVLPIRPNGTAGYVPASSIRINLTSYRIVVDREDLLLTLWRLCDVVKTFTIGLGKESTPTPNGTFYIISLLKPPAAGSVYGDYAYGLSAYSNAITNWKGGGVIGIHGTNDPSSIGNRKSHGCIRLRNQDIDQLVPILPLGTPVEIT